MIPSKRYVKGYDEGFKKSCNTGWGCGYVEVPASHPFFKIAKIEMLDGYDYIQLRNFDEEITWCEITGKNDNEVLTIGFDTAHSYNNSSHDKKYVEEKTEQMQNCVDAYTLDDVKKLKTQKITDYVIKINNI